jgi:hypothetical protein
VSNQTLIRLLAVAGGLVGTWLLITFLSGRPEPVPEAESEWSALLGGLTSGTVTSIVIEDSLGTRVLQAEDGGSRWTVDGFETDPAVVTRFWSAMGDAYVSDMVASNPENHERMGVAEGSTVTATFETASGPTTILVGAAGAAPGTAFVRRPGEDAVYLLQGGLRTHFVREQSEWREKRMLNLDTAAVHTVHIERPGESYTVIRADTSWTVDGAPARTFNVTSIMEELATLRGTDFLVPGDSLYELPLAITVTALGASGDTMTVVNLGEGERDRRGTVRGDSIVYRVPQFRIDRIAQPLANLVPPAN